MFLIRLFQKAIPVDGVANAAEFRRLIDEERMRVDRNTGRFSMVVFEIHRREHRSLPNDLLEACRNRLRKIDRAGMLTRRQIAILLPGTDSSGAAKVADDLLSIVNSDQSSFSKTLFTYPETSLPEVDLSESDADHRLIGARSPDELLVEPLPFWKRALDIFGASLGLMIAAPVMLAAAVAIRLDSRGPILFTQQRAGLGGKPFDIYKFRTMRVGAEELKHALRANSEQDGPAFKIRQDPRVTCVGKYLRRTCIDEFPQFWNVLKGDMSLVGPRPLPCDESDECLGWQQKRLSVTPGLTCIWQVSGGMKIPFVEWMRMDIRYIRSRSLWHDVKLLWATFVAVVLHRASH